jgi:rod shape-determining protein MreC
MFNRPARRRFRWWPLALLLVIAAVILMNTQFTGAPRDIASRVLVPVQRILSSAGAGLRDITGSFGDLATLRARNAELEKSVAQLTVENLQLKEVEIENARLRKLLGFAQANPSFNTKGGQIVARVIGSEPNSIIQAIVIDLGKGNGIQPGMPVVTERGLVGRVTEVYNNASRVLLITDSNSNVYTLLQNSRLRGILHGRAGQQPILDYLPQDNKVIVGDIVVTSGEGGNFPAGVPVGQVVEVEQNDVEMFQRAVVRTTVDFDTLETVLVVTSFTPLQDAIDLPDR